MEFVQQLPHPAARCKNKCFGPEGITLDGMKKVFPKQVYDPASVPEGVIERRTAVALTQPRRVFETFKVPNLSSTLGDIRCPVRVLWGANDQFCPVSGALKLATTIPDVDATIFGRCGH